MGKIVQQEEKKRCDWSSSLQDALYRDYHDKEWGVPEHRDNKLFEFLVLEGAQAGLSWATVLKKRENYLKVFDNFDPTKIAKYDEKRVNELLLNSGIIRNRLKIQATIQNAKSFLDVQRGFGSFDKYIWRFIGGKPKMNKWKTLKEIPAKTKESDVMSKDLINRGFKFVGSTICYAFMQATGMVNDHVVYCFRYKELSRLV
jgi:DNA-3-methyladenine glycosylase I